jgi:hypothetical protein
LGAEATLFVRGRGGDSLSLGVVVFLGVDHGTDLLSDAGIADPFAGAADASSEGTSRMPAPTTVANAYKGMHISEAIGSIDDLARPDPGTAAN